MVINPKRGEIWQVNLEPTIGQEIKKSRPAVVISSDLFSAIDLRIIIPITGWQDKFSQRPFMVKIVKDKLNGLDKDSAGNVLQVRSVSTRRFMY
jgi:mRNA interferase MazF